MTTYLFVTDPEINYPETVRNNPNDWWSCSRDTEYGDSLFVYLKGGQGIKYLWRAISSAKENEEWRYICKVRHERTFDPSITIQELRNNIVRDIWAAPYTNFRGMRSIKLKDEVAKLILSLRS